jgi:hypothetical protein
MRLTVHSEEGDTVSRRTVVVWASAQPTLGTLLADVLPRRDHVGVTGVNTVNLYVFVALSHLCQSGLSLAWIIYGG